MATYLKRRIDVAQSDADDLKVKQTVERILADVTARADAPGGAHCLARGEFRARNARGGGGNPGRAELR